MSGLRAMPVLAMLAAMAASALPAPASGAVDAGTDGGPTSGTCTGYIDALPAVIDAEGVWCLRGDLQTALASGSAIELGGPRADGNGWTGVTLDCRGFAIVGKGGPASTTVGVRVRSDEAQVRHCGVRGFRTGIRAFDAFVLSPRIEGNRLSGNWQRGIDVGEDALVRRNRILATGGSTIAESTVVDKAVVAIRGGGLIEDNDIDGVTGTTASPQSGSAWGIQLAAGTVLRNRIRNIAAVQDGSARAIWVPTPAPLSTATYVIAGNVIGGGGAGVACQIPHEHFVLRGNVFAHLVRAINTCPDGGENIVLP